MKQTILLVAMAIGFVFGSIDNIIGNTVCEGKSDTALDVCYSEAACMYMNELRQNSNIKPMAHGTTAMLLNAVQHSKTMANSAKLFHQKMGVKCGDTEHLWKHPTIVGNFRL